MWTVTTYFPSVPLSCKHPPLTGSLPRSLLETVSQVCIPKVPVAVTTPLHHLVPNTTHLHLLPKLRISGARTPLPLNAYLRDIDRENLMFLTDATYGSYTKCPRELISASWYASYTNTSTRNTYKHVKKVSSKGLHWRQQRTRRQHVPSQDKLD
jgi:hypothetical protein